MSTVLSFGSLRRAIRIGRWAGQFAKPRSAETETRDGVTLPSYRSDVDPRLNYEQAMELALLVARWMTGR